MSVETIFCDELGCDSELLPVDFDECNPSLAYNQIAMAEAYGRLQAALGDPSPQHRLFEFARVDGIPRSLATLKMPREGIDSTVARVLSNPYWNPRPLEAAPLRDLIERAWNGAVPDSPM